MTNRHAASSQTGGQVLFLGVFHLIYICEYSEVILLRSLLEGSGFCFKRLLNCTLYP